MTYTSIDLRRGLRSKRAAALGGYRALPDEGGEKFVGNVASHWQTLTD
jgi:hypothetical protein